MLGVVISTVCLQICVVNFVSLKLYKKKMYARTELEINSHALPAFVCFKGEFAFATQSADLI